MPSTPQSQSASLPTNLYKPSELLGMFSAYLSQQAVNRKVIYIRGIYLRNTKHDPRWSYRYDVIRDEDTQAELTLQITEKQTENLKDGNLVTVGGVLGRRVQNNGHIQLMLVVSRVEVMKEQVVDEDELKRIELRRKKASIGFKNVDGILEQKLFSDERPKIALVFATTSITMADFNAGINAAKSAIDFEEYRVNFSSPSDFTALLERLDPLGFDVIALVRGGGTNVETADDLNVLETIVGMSTPLIAAIGHVEERLFIKQIVDKEAPTPNGLGQYFSEMVESVSEKKTKSRATLTEKIRKQFQEQLEAGNKQNKELQDKLAKLTKNQEESTKKHNEQVEKINKLNQELQNKLEAINKTNEAAQKANTEQLEKLQQQLKTQAEESAKQSKQFNDNLKKMQEANAQLNKSVQQLTIQKTGIEKKLRATEKELEEANNKSGNEIWIIVALVLLAVCFALLIFR